MLENLRRSADNPNVEISPATTAAAATRIEPSADPKRAQLQSMLLRKMLDTQKSEADQFAKLLEGKGQTLDVRV